MGTTRSGDEVPASRRRASPPGVVPRARRSGRGRVRFSRPGSGPRSRARSGVRDPGARHPTALTRSSQREQDDRRPRERAAGFPMDFPFADAIHRLRRHRACRRPRDRGPARPSDPRPPEPGRGRPVIGRGRSGTGRRPPARRRPRSARGPSARACRGPGHRPERRSGRIGGEPPKEEGPGLISGPPGLPPRAALIPSTSRHAEDPTPHLLGRDLALIPGPRPGPLDQGEECRVGPQGDRLEVDVLQGQHHGRRRAVVGDDQRLGADARHVRS